MSAPNNPGGHVALPGVATGSNRINTSATFAASETSRTSQLLSNVIPAGSVLVLPAAGTRFYFVYASGNLNVRPNGGVFNTYSQGTGLAISNDYGNAFNLLELQNPNAVPVLFQIFIGFDNYIDNRLILQSQTQPQVAFPTYPTANVAPLVSFNDLSNGLFRDINNNPWYAVSRVAIIVSNIDGGVTMLLHKAGASGANDPAIAAIFPLTSLRLDVQGNYSLQVGGGNVNAICSEIYLAISAIPVVLPS